MDIRQNSETTNEQAIKALVLSGKLKSLWNELAAAIIAVAEEDDEEDDI